MKSWQDLHSKIGELVRQHPSASRWGAIAVVVMILIVWFANQSISGTRTVSLFDSRKLSVDEIGQMQVAFGKSGLNEYEIRGSQIEVPRALRGDYLKSLADHNAIPQDLASSAGQQSSFEFFQTRAQQRARQIDRKKQTIRDMVMQLRFVDRAIVDYDETRGATPFEEMQRTAVVNVTPLGNRVLEMPEIKAIRDTVRGAVAGLKSEDITIIDTFASKSHTGLGTLENEALQPHTLTKVRAERKYEDKIRSALTAYPGIRVNVEVGIDPVVRRIRDERNIEGEPVVVERTYQRETSARVPGASPSIFRNVFGQGANSQARVSSFTNPYQRSAEKTQSMANGSYQTTETAGPMITSVSVSIGIPEHCVQYFVEQNMTGRNPDDEELRRQSELVFEQLQNDIRQKVEPLVPQTESRQEMDDTQHIVVTLDRKIPLTANKEYQHSTSSSGSWDTAGVWTWIGLIGAGLFALVLLRSTSKNPRTDSPTSETGRALEISSETFIGNPADTTIASEAIFSVPPADVAGSPVEPDSELDNETQEHIRIQLDQWCRENPKAAAATIRQWLERKAG